MYCTVWGHVYFMYSTVGWGGGGVGEPLLYVQYTLGSSVLYV